MNDPLNSDIEKTQLEVHVDMSRQRYAILADKVDSADKRLEDLAEQFEEFRKEHAKLIHELREENAEQKYGTSKLFIGGVSTVFAGLLSTVVLILITLL